MTEEPRVYTNDEWLSHEEWVYWCEQQHANEQAEEAYQIYMDDGYETIECDESIWDRPQEAVGCG